MNLEKYPVNTYPVNPKKNSYSALFSNLRIQIYSFISKHEVILYPLTLWLIMAALAWLTSLIFTHGIGELHSTTSQFHSVIGTIDTYGAGLNSWDGLIFCELAQHGYIQPLTTPFFPLLPLAIRLLHHLTTWPYSHCGIIITNSAYLCALIILYRWLSSGYSERTTARQTLWLLTTFPPALFFNAVYSESITLLTTILFFYNLQRKRWYTAMWCGFFASIAHTLGAILAPVGLCYLWRHRHQLTRTHFWLRFCSLGIIIAGLALYLLYLQLHFGNALTFLLAEKHWDRTATIPVINVLQNLLHYSLYHPEGFTIKLFVNILNGCCTLLMVAMGIIMIYGYRHHGLMTIEMKLFFVLTLLASICSGTRHGSLEAYGRFMAVLFPGFIVWGDKLRHQTLYSYTLAVLISFKTILLGLFTCGYWVK